MDRGIRGRLKLAKLTPIAVLAALALGGCSSVPDAVNPAAWYRNTVDYFSDDEPATPSKKDPDNVASVRADRGKPPPGADKPFPNLASVPERPRAVAEGPIAQGLAADPSRPKYAPAIRRQGEAVQPLQPTPPAAAPPPPPASVTATPTAPPPPRPAPTPAKPEVAAAPPPAPPPPAAAAPAAPSLEATRQRLMAGLEPGAGGRPANAATPGLPEPAQTVVISSGGVETTSGSWQPVTVRSPAAAPTPGTTAAASQAAPLAGRLVRVATIQFAEGSTKLSDRDRYILAQVAKLQRQTGRRVRIVGHASSRAQAADPARQEAINIQVSAQRAGAVASELMRLGVSRDAVSASGVGDNRPLYTETTRSGEAGNRRAEIYFES